MIASNPVWRLIQTPPSQGAWNMALDEAILEFAGKGAVPPTLRLYAWSPACLSLGFAQPFDDVDLDSLSAQGWEVVRRPTGGRAILHTDELTYSVCGPSSDPLLSGGVLESYQKLSLALLKALELIGIDADSSKNQSPVDETEKNNPVCFEVPSNYEITVNGKKLIGSAQARRKSGVLQHGTLPLSGDLSRIIQVLDYPDEEKRHRASRRLLAHATTVEHVLGYPGDWWIAAQAFRRAFRTVHGVDLVPMSVRSDEGRRALELYAEKYANSDWTRKN